MKTFTITLLLLVALLSVYTANGAPSSVEGALRKKFEAGSMKIDETPIQSLRMLQEADNHNGHGDDDGHGDHDGHGHGDHDEEFNRDDIEKPWGPGLLAAFLVNLCTLIGVIAFVPASLFGSKASAQTKDFVFHIMIPSFACGALLATTVFLLIPESLVLLSGGHSEHGDEHEGEHRLLEDEGDAHEEDESGPTWKFGTCVLAGYFLPFILSGFFPHSHIPEGDKLCAEEVAPGATPGEVVAEEQAIDAEDNVDADDADTDSKVLGGSFRSKATEVDKEEQFAYETRPDYQLASSILAGDFFHNFADGVFIGSAFLLCDRNMAIIVTATTVFHELSQELADYFLLTNQCHFSTLKALAFNFVSGFSVMLGVIVIFATDVSDATIGVILAMSAGVYFYVALTECAPRVNAHLTSTTRRACSFLFWVIGAVPIGLVLLNHVHCD